MSRAGTEVFLSSAQSPPYPRRREYKNPAVKKGGAVGDRDGGWEWKLVPSFLSPTSSVAAEGKRLEGGAVAGC